MSEIKGESDMEMKSALQGIRVLDLGRVLAAPYCAMVMADMGAEVIKVEEPITGDESRAYKPLCGGISTYFINYNRSKKGITLNLKKKKGRELFFQLLENVDVVIENFRPGFMEENSLSYKELIRRKPDLIFCAISGYGQTGPYSPLPCYDPIAQAVSGMTSVTGWKGKEPAGCGGSIVDMMCGQTALIAILAALRYRRITGIGQAIDISLVDVAVSAMSSLTQYYLTEGTIPFKQGNQFAPFSPSGSVRGIDGNVMLVVDNELRWKRLCEQLGYSQWVKRDDLQTNDGRVRNRKELQIGLDQWAENRTVSEIMQILRKADIPAEPIRRVGDLIREQLASDGGLFSQIDGGTAGTVTVTNVPIKMSVTQPQVRGCAPLLGEHNGEIYVGELGLTLENLEMLRKEQVI